MTCAAVLSRNKLAAVRDFAAKCQARVVPTSGKTHSLTDDELVARLTEVRGIGPWTMIPGKRLYGASRELLR